MAFDLVLFGGTGDLTWRKLMPALFQAFRHGKLPAGGRILAVARDERSDDDYRAYIRDKFSGVEEAKQPSDEEYARFASLLHYRRMDLAQPEHYQGLKGWIDERGADTVVLFLATSPHLFPVICDQLGQAGLNAPHMRVVLEKPLGHDLASAQEINRVVRAAFREEQALRIDHYLGKPAVQNLMALRFGNALFEPLWRRESIANIQITLAESIGVGTRGDFYDRTGALRDMIQNHALQLLTILAMEPPSSNDADAIRDEKLKVLRSLKPFTRESIARDVVRGQYKAGTIDGRAVPGYLDEVKVPAGSRCETYVALRTEVQNWRWAGVPFLLRTGKRLPQRVTEIALQFKQPPLHLFRTVECAGDFCDLTEAQPTVLAFRIQPDEGISLAFSAKRPGMQFSLSPVRFDFDYEKAFEQPLSEAYERLLLDALRGDPTLFMPSDELEAAWEFVTPILEAWEKTKPDFPNYAAGTWGPAAADRLVAHCCAGGWRQP